MQLDSLRVSSETGLCVNVSSFQPLTLLVGVSGAGKSQILMYIETLFKLLQGHTASNLEDGEYELCFHLNEDNYHYLVYIQDHHPVIERLWLNDQLISDESPLIEFLPSFKRLKPINQLRNTPELTKRFLLATPQQQEEISSLLQFIFESITDIQVKCTPLLPLQLFFKDPADNWLNLDTLSDGMLKSFYYLTEIILSPAGSIILIDEFENGLGLNCMGPLLEQMLIREDIQLILSSHHPYIIHNIPNEAWRIITREQSLIHVQSAQEFGIGQTKYDAFFELMNRLEFEGGI